MKRTYWFFVLCLFPWITQAYTISGSVSGGGLVRIAAAVPVQADTFYAGVVIPFLNTYSISAPGGNYIVAAFSDDNANGAIDPGEPLGWWGGNFPDIIAVNSNVGGINLSLSASNGGSFSGYLSYSGSQSGPAFVRAFTNSSFTGDPIGGGLIFNNTTGNGTFTGMTTVFGTFYADAFIDLNGNLMPDPGEPYGIYGGATPQSFQVQSSTGPTTINITISDAVVVPENDTCPGTEISALPYTDSGSTAGAVPDYSGCISASSNDVIYHLQPVGCQDVTVSLCGSGYDTALEIRDGSQACPGGVPIACNDDFCDLQSQVTFASAAGMDYYIIVHGYQTANGDYSLSVSGVPTPQPSDACPGVEITTFPGTISSSTSCLTNTYGHCVFGNSADEVWTLTLPECFTVTASTCGGGTNFDTALEIRTGGSCPGDVLIACNDDSCGLQSTLGFEAEADQEYFILVYGYNVASGNYDLTLSGVPCPPDTLPAPQALTAIANGTDIELRWNPVDGAATYDVYVSADPENTPATLLTSVATPELTLPEQVLQPDASLFYTVVAQGPAASQAGLSDEDLRVIHAQGLLKLEASGLQDRNSAAGK